MHIDHKNSKCFINSKICRSMRTAFNVWSLTMQHKPATFPGGEGRRARRFRAGPLSCRCPVTSSTGTQSVSGLMIIKLVHVNKNDHGSAFMQLRLRHTIQSWARSGRRRVSSTMVTILRPPILNLRRSVYDSNRYGYVSMSLFYIHFPKIPNTTYWAYLWSPTNLWGQGIKVKDAIITRVLLKTQVFDRLY